MALKNFPDFDNVQTANQVTCTGISAGRVGLQRFLIHLGDTGWRQR